MKKGELITAVISIVISLIAIIEAARLGFGWQADGPEAGFALFWLGVLMLVCSAGILVNAVRSKDEEDFFVSREGMMEAVRIAFTSFLIAIGIVYMGVYISTLIYSALFSRWLGKHRWRTVIAFSLITTIAVFFGMEKGLKLPLPKSILYQKGLFFF
ncbi:MAG: tripartite tricarboxylate transporter TctB family protein [bacterium]